MAMRSLILTGLISMACATSNRQPWPASQASPRVRSLPLSDAQGGPLNERSVVTLGPPVQIRYAPEAVSESRPQSPGILFLTWPLPATGITSMYGERTDPIDRRSRWHRGIDMEAEYGTTVMASADGQIVAAGWNGGYGRQIVIEHGGGYQTVYAHLSQILVPLRARVKAGQAIGRVGNSGRSTGAHLHFEVKAWNRHIDPLDVLGVELEIEP